MLKQALQSVCGDDEPCDATGYLRVRVAGAQIVVQWGSWSDVAALWMIAIVLICVVLLGARLAGAL